VQAIEDPVLIEALQIQFEIRQIEGKGKLSESDAAFFHAVNLRRSQLPQGEEAPLTPEPLRPDLANRTLRASLGVGNGPRGWTLEPGWRPALHGLLEREDGYTPNSELEVMNLRARYEFSTGRFALHDAKLLKVMSLTPYDGLHRSRAYEMSAGLFSPQDEMCLDCVEGRLRFGYGNALELGSRAVAYSMVTFQSDFWGPRDYRFRFGPGFRGGAILRETPNLKTILDFKWNRFVNHVSRPDSIAVEVGQGLYQSSTSETHLSVTSSNAIWEAELTQHFFF
jgi:hypothetical protein